MLGSHKSAGETAARYGTDRYSRVRVQACWDPYINSCGACWRATNLDLSLREATLPLHAMCLWSGLRRAAAAVLDAVCEDAQFRAGGRPRQCCQPMASLLGCSRGRARQASRSAEGLPQAVQGTAVLEPKIRVLGPSSAKQARQPSSLSVAPAGPGPSTGTRVFSSLRLIMYADSANLHTSTRNHASA